MKLTTINLNCFKTNTNVLLQKSNVPMEIINSMEKFYLIKKLKNKIATNRLSAPVAIFVPMDIVDMLEYFVQLTNSHILREYMGAKDLKVNYSS